jgi:hypothetical protein
VALGQAALRSRFDLGAPLSVRYRLVFAEVPRPPVNPYFYLGIADDRSEHFVAAINFRTLLAIDGAKIDQQSGKGSALSSVELGSVYDLELVHDGKKVSLRCRDQEIAVQAGQRQSGAVFLRAHSVYPVQVLELVIEGRLAPAALAAMRKARVERELATF